MYSTWSRQKLQTLRRRRSKSGIGPHSSEGDVVGVDVAAGSHGCGLRVTGRRRSAGTILPAVQELHVVGVHLGAITLLAALGVLPGSRLQTSLDVYEAALLQVLAAQLGELAIALIPDHDVVVVGELAALSRLILTVTVGGDGQVAHRRTARRVAELGVPGQPADQHHAIERTRHHSSPSSSLAEGASASSWSSASSSPPPADGVLTTGAGSPPAGVSPAISSGATSSISPSGSGIGP